MKLGFEGVSVEGQAKGEKVTINNNNDAETTIRSVCYVLMPCNGADNRHIAYLGPEVAISSPTRFPSGHLTL